MPLSHSKIAPASIVREPLTVALKQPESVPEMISTEGEIFPSLEMTAAPSEGAKVTNPLPVNVPTVCRKVPVPLKLKIEFPTATAPLLEKLFPLKVNEKPLRLNVADVATTIIDGETLRLLKSRAVEEGLIEIWFEVQTPAPERLKVPVAVGIKTVATEIVPLLTIEAVPAVIRGSKFPAPESVAVFATVIVLQIPVKPVLMLTFVPPEIVTLSPSEGTPAPPQVLMSCHEPEPTLVKFAAIADEQKKSVIKPMIAKVKTEFRIELYRSFRNSNQNEKCL